MRIPLLLADFIHARACRPKCEKFLTLPDVGFYVLKNLKNFCTDSGKGFSCSMISNGSLLTGDILDKLTEFQCRHIQITLDGIEETHNKRRI